MRHRVARVHREIHDHLLDGGRVREDAARGLGDEDIDLHAFADSSLDDALHSDDGLSEIDHVRLEHLLAAEGEQLPREVAIRIVRELR